jgi:hypothetical protein
VRVVAVTRGEEAFIDVDGDGVYTVGVDVFEPTFDLPEPFIDINDNGEWDPDEEFRDANSDGLWTPANGEWDAATEIWSSTTVLWVGDLFHCNLGGIWQNHPDCGCDPPMNMRPPNDCEENVGRSLLHTELLTLTCLEGCIETEPRCPEGAVVFGPEGGRMHLQAAFQDINGNCLGTLLPDGREPSYRIETSSPEAVEIIAPEGSLRELCFSGPERPIARPVETEIAVAPARRPQVINAMVRIEYADVAGLQMYEVPWQICIAP